jgi:hypothetical protein
MPRMLMNINGSNINNRTLAQFAVRSVNNQMNNNVSSQSVRLNLMSPMIGRVASAKASCGACGK